MTKGKLIVIDGTDCSGKETQTKMLIDRLTSEEIPCATMSFPRYDTPTGRIIGQCYLGKPNLGKGDVKWFGNPVELDPYIASLYYAADRCAAVPEIKKILGSGINLILDRFDVANKGHQGSKILDRNERRIYFNCSDKLEREVLGIPKPDYSLLLYMPWEVAAELKKTRNEIPDGHEASQEHLKRAEQTYLELAESDFDAQIDCAPDRTMKSLKTREDIHKEVYNIITKEALNII